jgi:adenylyltransferase/sulfurtransferase
MGVEGQQKLKNGSVLVIGAGGLGSPALYYLAAAGVGRLGVLDFDVVDESNLQRQILYTTSDVGNMKTAVAADRLEALNPNIKIARHPGVLNSQNAMELISGYDVVIDGSDNLPTRYLVNDACVLLKKILVYGAIFQFEGHVSVFNALEKDGSRGPNYRDLFPVPPPPEMVPSCSEGGVLGVLPGIIGSMQANEAIKVVAGIGKTLSGRMIIFDSLDFTTRFLNLSCRADNPVSGLAPSIHQLIDYDQFCNPSHAPATKTMKEISALEVRKLLDQGEAVQLIDVRETYEFEFGNIGGINIPLHALPDNIERINTDGRVVLHCKSGKRGDQALRLLEKQFGLRNLLNLQGGLLQWQALVDNSVDVY